MTPPQVWITRTEPGATATAGRVRALGMEPLIAPLLAVRPLAFSPGDLSDFAALAFTSAQAPALFVEGLGSSAPSVQALPVFAVGNATADAARAAGFSAVTSADGDVAALARRIGALAPSLTGAVLHPSAVQAAGDLAGDLAALGIRARTLAVYETAEVDPWPRVAPHLETLEAVLVHSPRAGRALFAFLTRHPAPNLRIFALSEAAGAPLKGVNRAGQAIAPFPNDASLLSLLTAGSQRPGNESPDP
jgi:uroporphyrinogen-III synthase